MTWQVVPWCQVASGAGNPGGRNRTDVVHVSGASWFLSIGLGILYLVLLFTVAVITFRKGHWVLGLIGIFIPILWLLGAILPARPGSSYRRSHAR